VALIIQCYPMSSLVDSKQAIIVFLLYKNSLRIMNEYPDLFYIATVFIFLLPKTKKTK
jgi:hypothetical protein